MTTGHFEDERTVMPGPATHLTVFVAPVDRSALAEALDADADDFVDAESFAAACARLEHARAEGLAIVAENIAAETALVGTARARLDARLDELSRRADEIEGAIEAVDRGARTATIPVDLGALRGALVQLDAARRDPDGPDADALALADEIEAADALRAHARRAAESPMVAAAEAEVADARAELARVRDEVGAIDPGLVRAVHDAHARVEECLALLERSKRAARAAARVALESALAAEADALRDCGFSTYPTFLVQIAQGGTRPEDDARLAAAQNAVAHAEAARRRAAALAAVPTDDELDADEIDRRARAAAMLGRDAGADAAAALRALRSPGQALALALDELCDALEALGVDPGADPAATARALVAAPPATAAGSDVEALEAELAQLDEEGSRAAQEHERLGHRLAELARQAEMVAGTPSITPETIDPDDAETLVRDLIESAGDLLVVVEAFDALGEAALERVLALCAASDAASGTPEIVVVSTVPIVGPWARAVGAEVLDALPDPVPDARSDAIAERVPAAAPDESARSESASEAEPATVLRALPDPASVVDTDAVYALLAEVRQRPEPEPDPVAELDADADGATNPDVAREATPVSHAATEDEPVLPEPLPMVAAEPVSAPPSPVHDHEPVAASVADDLVPGPREFLVPRPAASAPADVRSLARIERARRRAQRKVEREQKMARKLAQRFDQYAGAVYQQESEIAPWAHWEQAAASRREITGDLAAGVTDLQRSRAAEARAAADRVEERTGIVVEDRSVMHQCVFHRNTETRVRCTRCAEPFCDQCLVTVGPKRELICVECAVKAAGVRERRRRG